MQLWHRYLQERAVAARHLSVLHSARDALHNAYERALVTMHKMPRIWLEYGESLMAQGRVTQTRRTLDRALAALPVTQHDRLWQLYLKFVMQADMPMDTAFRVYRRYLQCARHAELAASARSSHLRCCNGHMVSRRRCITARMGVQDGARAPGRVRGVPAQQGAVGAGRRGARQAGQR